MKAIQRKIEESIERLEHLSLLYQKKDGFVVESDSHINVGDHHGLNGTDFAVKGPLSSAEAVVFETIDEAEKCGVDYYLVDGNRNPIKMRIIPASEFFSKEAETYKSLLVYFEEDTK